MFYSLQEIYEIRKNMISYVLPTEIMIKIQDIEKEIGNSIKPSTSSTSYEPIRRTANPNPNPNPNTTNSKNYRPIPNRNTNTNTSSYSFPKKLLPSSDDLSWENVRNFKTTKIDKKEGIDKRINDIRICLNKISAKNYDTQKETIFEHIRACISDSLESELKEALQKVAMAIFDIASTNKFFSEIYAKLYKSLVDLYPIFDQVLNTFVEKFMDSLQEIKYVDPNEDYDLFCSYNKQNDKRKASAVFLIHMMKIDILSVSTITEILSKLVLKIEENMEQPNRLNEVEEMTEVLFLFLQEGYGFLLSSSSSSSSFIFEKVRLFATYKVKEKASLSSRVIFKYMDLVGIMNKK